MVEVILGILIRKPVRKFCERKGYLLDTPDSDNRAS